MSYRTLRYEIADYILTLTLNRPDHLNAFTVEMGHANSSRLLIAPVMMTMCAQ